LSVRFVCQGGESITLIELRKYCKFCQLGFGPRDPDKDIICQN